MTAQTNILTLRRVLLLLVIGSIGMVLYTSGLMHRMVASFTMTPQVAANNLIGPVEEHFEQIPIVSIAEAQQQVSFTIPLPSKVPDNLELKGASVRDNWVSVRYGPATPQSGFGMGFSVQPGTGIGGSQYVFPEHAKQAIAVNGNPAVCVEGSWNSLNQWKPNNDAIHLGWSDGTLSYRLGGSGLQIDCAEAVKIAESIS